MSDEAVRKEFQEFRKRRKGYLVDEQSFIAGWEAGRSAAIQECADLVFDALLAGAATVNAKRDLFEFLQVTADNLRDGVLALKER